MATQQQFKVQRGKASFGASADQLDVSITAVGSLTRAFARVTGVLASSHGETAGSNTARTNRDVSVTCELSDVDTVTLKRPASATDIDVAVWWEVLEYVGPAGGPHEIVVHDHSTRQIAAAATSVDGADFASPDPSKCVPIVTGSINGSAGSTWGTNVAVKADFIDDGDGTGKARYTRTGSTFVIQLSTCVVEFRGSHWSVQRQAFTFSATGVTSFSCSSVAWATTLIIATCESGGNNNRDLTALFFEGADSTHFKGHIEVSSDLTARDGVAFLVSHPKMFVKRDDSEEGTLAGYSTSVTLPQNEQRTIPGGGTPIPDTSRAIAWCYTTNTASTPAYPGAHWSYAILDGTTVEFERSRGNAGNGNLGLQVADLASIAIEQESASKEGASEVAVAVGVRLDCQLEGDAEADCVAGPDASVDVEGASEVEASSRIILPAQGSEDEEARKRRDRAVTRPPPRVVFPIRDPRDDEEEPPVTVVIKT